MQTKKQIKLGVIADDFTGASDAASFLVKSGARTIMFTAVPDHLDQACDAVVIALKTRSVAPEDAILQTSEAFAFLTAMHCEQIYVKYCSTFDSTRQGNIGVVLDFLMEKMNQPYTILCPSLPVNGRTVKDGILYVHGEKLSDSPMKHHPLNPMWDSYLPALMKEQSRYPCYTVSKEELKQGKLKQKISDLSTSQQRFYLVPDYGSDEDGRDIAEQFKHLPLLSGGSGLLEFILDPVSCIGEDSNNHQKQQRSLILCGSCSLATQQQIAHFKASGGHCYAVDSKALLRGTQTVKGVFDYLQQQTECVLVYSDAVDQELASLQQSSTFLLESRLIEQLMAEVSVLAITHGYTNVVVAGGETSGAVTLRLGFDGFYIGESIDPGVPVLYPIKNKAVRFILKSGNFGSVDFFTKAIGGDTNG